MSSDAVKVSGGGGVGPSGDLDPVDEFLLLNTFEQAAAYLQQARGLKLSNAEKLKFYGLFKQTTIGENQSPQPSLFLMYDRAKWKAWKEVGKLPKDKAAQQYIQLLDELSPEWRSTVVKLADQEVEEEELDLDATSSEEEWDQQQSSSNDGFGINVSRPVQEEEDEEELQGMFLAASRGDLEGIKRAVLEGEDMTASAPSEDGEMSCLHIAVDRGHDQLIPSLVEMKADVDQLDDMKQTPLHYAVTIERLQCVRLLLNHGASFDLPDDSGETAKMIGSKARDPEIRRIFQMERPGGEKVKEE